MLVRSHHTSQARKMASYYVNTNAQDNGDHEVHREGCRVMPALANRLYLGDFAGCHAAVGAAKQHYRQSNGCIHCSPDCHTS